MRRGLKLGLLLALLMTVPATAVTTVTYRGQTSQHLPAKVVVTDGTLQLVYVKWVGHCRNRHFVWRDKTYYRNMPEGPIERQGDAFSDSGRLVERYKDGTKAVRTARMAGTFLPDNKVIGKHAETVRLYNKRGKRIDYCHVKVNFGATAG
jgi:hypothetical protein